MITCRELTDFLMSYIERELPADQRAAFDAHLRACPPCQRYLDTYIQTVRLTKAACRGGSPEATENAAGSACAKVPEEMIRAILAARKNATGTSR